MARTKETRNRSRSSTPSTQNLDMNVAASLHSSSPKLVSLKGPSVASSLKNSDKLQKNRTLKNNITYNIMNKNNLSNLTKDQLIDLLIKRIAPKPAPRGKWRKQETPTPTPTPLPRRNKYIPIPYPRKSVKQMVQDYENKIIEPPAPFADKP